MLPKIQLADNIGDESILPLDEENDLKFSKYESPEQIGDCLSVSGLPNSRWISLVNLKLIKQRNKVSCSAFDTKDLVEVKIWDSLKFTQDSPLGNLQNLKK